MERRRVRGQVPIITVVFGDKDESPTAPLHRRLGIRTYVHLQATLDYYHESNRRQYAPHTYRMKVTLPRIFE